MSAPAANDVVSFKDRATADQAKPHNDLLVIDLMIQDIDIARVFVDTGCSANIIYKSTLESMEIDLCAVTEGPSLIFGLSGDATMTLGSINLVVKAGRVIKVTKFLLIDRPTSYNAIVGTPWLNSMRAIPTTFHLCLKFPTPRGVKTIQRDRRMSQVCFAAELKRKNFAIKTSHKNKRKLTLDENAPERDSEVFWQSQRAKALEGKREPTCEPVISICLDESSPERCIEIGANLREPLKTELIACLKKNLNAFAWAAEDMPGIDIGITCHDLNNDPTYKPVKQKRRKLGPERATAVNEEVKRLLKIMMNPDDREKTAFITDRGTYCYKVMAFGLRNAGATYQRLVNRIFSEQLGKTMEVYIDDMLVKSLDEHDHVSHLEECFARLNAHNMKLNPAKCRFAVASGEFLGYLVTCRGIEANPTQINMLIEMVSPKTKREVQRLTGRVASLNRFISRSTDRSLPFYDTLKGNKKFEWSEECEKAFQQLKRYLLVANQYSGEYEARDERMDAYLKLIQDLSRDFNHFALTRIPRSENTQVDALAALASSSDSGLRRVIPVEFIEHPSIGPPVFANLI
ncbi:PREDICTED: uncharacterized protein LOC106297417 [Brassica oleracea var. oleracea]|uniref:uncharacterized protein LOC106297417 n=1 Tax=Brassica oleracea var. oleracea TaxID=109376 RepID=UPI0006A6D9C0|nr:PREDICTED: uncharacterized protein LOC106297417 [Brassica oleracea var. oleracea]